MISNNLEEKSEKQLINIHHMYNISITGNNNMKQNQQLYIYWWPKNKLCEYQPEKKSTNNDHLYNTQ